MEKLHRHFGELITDSEIDRVVPRSVNTKAKVLRDLRRSEIRVYMRAAAVAEKILLDEELDENGACGESYGISYEEGKHALVGQSDSEDDYTWEVEDGTAFRVKDKLYDQMWAWDRQGHRRVERDYQQIINALRIL